MPGLNDFFMSTPNCSTRPSFKYSQNICWAFWILIMAIFIGSVFYVLSPRKKRKMCRRGEVPAMEYEVIALFVELVLIAMMYYHCKNCNGLEGFAKFIVLALIWAIVVAIFKPKYCRKVKKRRKERFATNCDPGNPTCIQGSVGLRGQAAVEFSGTYMLVAVEGFEDQDPPEIVPALGIAVPGEVTNIDACGATSETDSSCRFTVQYTLGEIFVPGGDGPRRERFTKRNASTPQTNVKAMLARLTAQKPAKALARAVRATQAPAPAGRAALGGSTSGSAALAEELEIDNVGLGGQAQIGVTGVYMLVMIAPDTFPPVLLDGTGTVELILNQGTHMVPVDVSGIATSPCCGAKVIAPCADVPELTCYAQNGIPSGPNCDPQQCAADSGEFVQCCADGFHPCSIKTQEECDNAGGVAGQYCIRDGDDCEIAECQDGDDDTCTGSDVCIEGECVDDD